MAKSDGGSAFPSHRLCHWSELSEKKSAGEPEFYQQPMGGMSLRDYFAGQALAALVRTVSVDVDGEDFEPTNDDIALCAYGLADAMLAERAK